MAEIVTGVDDEIGLEIIGQRRDPGLLALLPGRHVGIGHVQDADRGRALGQQVQRVAADRVEVPLDADAPHCGPDADRPHRGQGGEGGLAGCRRH